MKTIGPIGPLKLNNTEQVATVHVYVDLTTSMISGRINRETQHLIYGSDSKKPLSLDKL